MQVSKWGNSLAVRLPSSIVKALHLKEGDDIEITIAEERLFEITKKNDRDQRLKRLRAFRGTIPAGLIWNREDANARE